LSRRVFGSFILQEWERVMEDCHKRSCWKNSIGVRVPRPCGLDVYVCSESCQLCLTVVYWLLECNKVPSWIENPENVTIHIFYSNWRCPNEHLSSVWLKDTMKLEYCYILGFLGNITSAPCCISLVTQQLQRRRYYGNGGVVYKRETSSERS
jgi:hypothetical protein